MLPPAIPIFPLPNVVLFPNVFLPLHIFEPRYRELVADALKGDRIIGMVLLRPGWESQYEGRPPVYPIGCAGLITHSEPLPDGRYNIVLRGLEKFRIVDENHARAYRMARVDTLEDAAATDERSALREHRRRLEALVVPREGKCAELRVPEGMPDEELINALAQYLELEPLERLALLEQPGALARCQSLIELLEMKVMAARHGGTGVVH